MVAFLALGILTATLGYLLLPSSTHDMDDIAATFPERFTALADGLGIATTPGSEPVKRVQSAMASFRSAQVACSLVLFVLLLTALVFATRIVTLFEIVQSALCVASSTRHRPATPPDPRALLR